MIEAGLRWRKTLQVYSVQDRTGVGHARHLDALPNNNMQSSLIADHNRGFDQNRIIQRPCFQCARSVPGTSRSAKGSSKARSATSTPAPSGWIPSGTWGSKATRLYLAERINDLGIECGHFSFGAGVLFEAWEKGLIGPEDTDGMRFGGEIWK